jgi:hypothetical protein
MSLEHPLMASERSFASKAQAFDHFPFPATLAFQGDFAECFAIQHQSVLASATFQGIGFHQLLSAWHLSSFLLSSEP